MEACLGVRHTNSMQFVTVEKLQKSRKSRNCTNLCNALTSAHALRCAEVSKTNGGKQIEFSAESNQFEKKIKSGNK